MPDVKPDLNYILQPYDDLLQLILDRGIKTKNRTGTDCLTIFGTQSRYDISQFFPLLTKRKVFPKSIFVELLWILSGSTNVQDLEKLGSKIWSPWKDEKFEQSHLYEPGELGPIYGFQLRHFGADYRDRKYFKDAGYLNLNLGIDQLSYVIKELKEHPESRRILFSYWNPTDVLTDKVRLPPCHHTFMLNVMEGKLSGMLFQRSGDVPIGVPANIQFYSTLIYMLAVEANLQPQEFIHSIGNAHIYENQIEGVKEYLSRAPKFSPTLKLNKVKDIFSYQVDDFVVENYEPAEAIKIPVAI